LKLIEALELLRKPSPDSGPVVSAYLACSFTPLHLQTFLAAELRQHAPSARVDVTTGLFGDLIGNVERGEASDADVVVAIIEWGDLDPRLSIRSLGGWRTTDMADVLEVAPERLHHLAGVVRRVSTAKTVVCCLPTLPLPPVFHTVPEHAGAHELHLRATLASFAADLGDARGVRILSPQALDARSPAADRFDAKSELTTGFPYTLSHAAALAESLTVLLGGGQPKKGLITDLDETLWSGLLGEVGADGIGWTLDRDAQVHGLYQQLLASLASTGILIGVASKNDPVLVDEAFARDDLLLSREDVFPLEVTWGSKAESVRRILETWNVSPDSVVFVDDSPTEVAEVQEALPEIEAIVFPGADQTEFWALAQRLRALFGKPAVSEEDALRLSSIRAASGIRAERADDTLGYSDDFLRSAAGSLTFAVEQALDSRALELINKTNQFNLNGRRLSESEMSRFLDNPDAFLVTVSYKDRFGPLGKIGVLLATQQGRELLVSTWVLSCRAFSRRIEHHSLAYLFEKFDIEAVVLDFEQTTRNSVLEGFLTSFDKAPEAGLIEITREAFRARTSPLVHEVIEGV
jgi:FkbH-like protein